MKVSELLCYVAYYYSGLLQSRKTVSICAFQSKLLPENRASLTMLLKNLAHHLKLRRILEPIPKLRIILRYYQAVGDKIRHVRNYLTLALNNLPRNQGKLIELCMQLPLRVAMAGCLVPFTFVKAEGGSYLLLQPAKGIRRLVGGLFQLVILIRVGLVLCLCLDENFKWREGELISGSGVMYCVFALVALYPGLSLVTYHLKKRDLIDFYNSAILMTNCCAGTHGEMENFLMTSERTRTELLVALSLANWVSAIPVAALSVLLTFQDSSLVLWHQVSSLIASEEEHAAAKTTLARWVVNTVDYFSLASLDLLAAVSTSLLVHVVITATVMLRTVEQKRMHWSRKRRFHMQVEMCLLAYNRFSRKFLSLILIGTTVSSVTSNVLVIKLIQVGKIRAYFVFLCGNSLLCTGGAYLWIKLLKDVSDYSVSLLDTIEREIILNIRSTFRRNHRQGWPRRIHTASRRPPPPTEGSIRMKGWRHRRPPIRMQLSMFFEVEGNVELDYLGLIIDNTLSGLFMISGVASNVGDNVLI